MPKENQGVHKQLIAMAWRVYMTEFDTVGQPERLMIWCTCWIASVKSSSEKDLHEHVSLGGMQGLFWCINFTFQVGFESKQQMQINHELQWRLKELQQLYQPSCLVATVGDVGSPWQLPGKSPSHVPIWGQHSEWTFDSDDCLYTWISILSKPSWSSPHHYWPPCLLNG